MKWPWPDLSSRARSPELMDDLSIDGAELTETLAQLRRINHLLGAAWPTLEGVSRLWHRAGRPARLSLLDVGAGSGDVAELLLPWAERRNLDMQLTLLDIHPHTCAVAGQWNRAESRVGVVQGDIYRLGIQQVDIVIASLFLHHIPSRQLSTVLDSLQQAARLGVVVNDLHRHWLAWAFIKAATRLFSGNRLIRHDAPLSVRRGFRTGDLEWLKNEAGLKQLTYYWRPFFRYLIILPTTNGGAP